MLKVLGCEVVRIDGMMDEMRSMELINFFFSSRRRHTRWTGDWSSDVCSSDLEQRARIVHHLDHQVPMRVLTAPHRLEHVRLELAPRLDVDMNVGDPGQCLTGCQPGVIHGAQKVRWDRSGFNYALVRTPSGRNTGSCAAATVRAAPPPSPVAMLRSAT